MNTPPQPVPDAEPLPDVEPPQDLGRHVRAREFVTAAWAAHHAEIHAFLARATHDPAVAEELLQETFLRLTEEARTRRSPELVRPWLYRVASNLVVSRARRRTTVQRWLEGVGSREQVAQTSPSPEAGLLRRERAAAVEQALRRLPADARLALLLSSEGFSGEEIAASIGRTHAATRTLLTRSRLRLRTDLAAEVAS